MIYGTPSIHVDDDQTDRIGLRTLVLSQLWQPSTWPLDLFEFDGEKPAPPAVSGGLLLIGEQTRHERGALRTSWTFEGINGDGKSVTFKDRAHSIDYWFEPGFSERPLLQLPGIQDLMDTYGGQPEQGQILWQPTIPTGSGSANGAVKSSGGDGTLNPLYGRESYFDIEGTYHFRYAVVDLSEIPDIAGKIFNNSSALPGRAPRYVLTTGSDGLPAGRNWLGLAPAPRRVGPIYEVEESYWLSGEGGWPAQIYGDGRKSASGFNGFGVLPIGFGI